MIDQVKLAVNIERIREKAKKDFKWFLFNLVKTYDWETQSIRPFPKEKCYEILADEILNNQYILIVKSRQIRITWFVCAYIVWLCNFRPGIFAVVKSTKFEKSGWGGGEEGQKGRIVGDIQALLSRCYFIWNNLIAVKTPTAISKQPAQLKFLFPDGGVSIIHACSANPEELRQFTISLLFIDEGAYQKDMELAYKASIPSLVSDGKVIIVSTPRGKNYFYNLLYDLVGRL
jgi:hypothetical protein